MIEINYLQLLEFEFQNKKNNDWLMCGYLNKILSCRVKMVCVNRRVNRSKTSSNKKWNRFFEVYCLDYKELIGLSQS